MLLTDPRISKSAAAWREWEGKLIDRFLLTQLLGSSGQSAVFLTTRGSGQPAAIKLVIPETEEAGARQLRAWELAAGLAHANLARLFERGGARIEATPLVYVVTEYAEENLAQILPERPLTEKETREMLVPALAALGYLHAKGFAHGRLKPSNVLSIGEHLKLSGDGPCRFGAEDSAAGENGVYHAPELTGGKRTAAADVWSLGVMLREALTQRAAISGGEKLAAPFAEIVRGCVEPSPEKRWGLARIGAALNGDPKPKAAEIAPAAKTPTLPISAARPTVMPQKPLAAKSGALAETAPAFLRHSEIADDAEDGSGRRRLALLAVIAAVVLVLIFAAVKLLHRDAAAQRAAAVPAAASSATSVSEPPVASPSAPVPPAAAVHEVVPDVPHAASATIHGTIKVRVRVATDESGRVTQAAIVRAGSSKYFAKLALQAARAWVFSPQASNGSRTLQFEFRRSGSRAHVL